jgi:hypothetical protein
MLFTPIVAGLHQAPLPPPTRQFGGQGLQRGRPEPPEVAEPHIDLMQRLAVDRVEPPRSLRPHRGESGFAQHAQVLGDRGLGDPELLLDDRAHRTRSPLPVREQLQDPPPHRVAEHVERMHAASL